MASSPDDVFGLRALRQRLFERALQDGQRDSADLSGLAAGLDALDAKLDMVLLRLAEVDDHSRDRTGEIRQQIEGFSRELDRPHQATERQRTVVPLMPGEVLTETRFGGFLVVPAYNVDIAPGLIRDGLIEPWVTRLVMRLLRPGETYMNVGANFGYYAVLGAQLVGRTGRVVAIEANEHVFPFLLRSTLHSGYPDVIQCYCFAAFSPGSESLTIRYDPQFIGGGSVMDNDGRLWSGEQHGRPSFKRLEDAIWSGENIGLSLFEDRRFVNRGIFVDTSCVTRSLDEAFPDLSEVTLLQMDIEGAETHALLGAEHLLDRALPEIIMEWSGERLKNADRDEVRRALGLLERRGYVPYLIATEDAGDLDMRPQLRRYRWAALEEVPHGNLLLTRGRALELSDPVVL